MQRVVRAVSERAGGTRAHNCDADAAAAATVVDLEPLVPERFSVRDRESANWVVTRVLATERAVEDAKAWVERLVRRAERDREFFLRRFGAEMQAWAGAEIAKLKGRCKSIDLPAGRVGFRTATEKLVVDDEQAALDWAKRHCRSAVVTVQKLSKAALNEHVEQTGEVPDGSHLEPQKEVFYIR